MMVVAKPPFLGHGMNTMIGLVSTSSRAGVLVCNFTLAPFLGRSWRSLMRVAAGLFAAGVVLLQLGIDRPPGQTPPAKPSAGATLETPGQPHGAGTGLDLARHEAAEPVSTLQTLKVLLTTPKMLMAFTINGFINPLFMFATMLPLYLVQALKYSPADVARVSSGFPLGATISVALATAVWDRMSSAGRAVYCLSSTSVAVAAAAAVWQGLVKGKTAMTVALALMLGGVTPTWYIPTTGYLNQAGGRRSGTLITWLDVPGYALSTAFLGWVPAMVERGGWNIVWRTLTGFLVVTLASSAAFFCLETRNPTVGVHPRLEGTKRRTA
jgi:hypothetical protein